MLDLPDYKDDVGERLVHVADACPELSSLFRVALENGVSNDEEEEDDNDDSESNNKHGGEHDKSKETNKEESDKHNESKETDKEQKECTESIVDVGISLFDRYVRLKNGSLYKP